MKRAITQFFAGILIVSWGAVNAEVFDGIGKSFGNSAAQTSKSGAPMPPNHPPLGNANTTGTNNTGMAPNMKQPEGPVSQGKVLDVTNGSGYSYLLIEAGGKQFWIAGTQVTANKGDVVSYIENVVMKNFHSKSLNKTFETIVFASSVNVVQ